METLEYWKNLIQNEKNAIPDRVGGTPLSYIIDKISNLPGNHEEKKLAEFFIGELSKYFSEFTIIDIRNLMLFIESVNFNNSGDIARRYWKDFENLGNLTDEQIEKRGMILRFITYNSNFPFAAERIKKETKLKEKFRLLWIESVANRDWELCINEVIEFLKENYGYEELRFYFSTWIENDDGKTKLRNAFNAWYPHLKKGDQIDLWKWAKGHDINIDLITNETEISQPLLASEALKFLERTSQN